MSVNGILLGKNDTLNNDSLNFKFYNTLTTSEEGWTSINLPNGYIYKIFINKITNWGNRDDSMYIGINNDSTYPYRYYRSSFLTSYSPRPWGIQSTLQDSRDSRFNLTGNSPYSNTEDEAPLYLDLYALSNKGWCIIKYPNLSESYIKWSTTSNISLAYYNYNYNYNPAKIVAKIYRTNFIL